MKRNPIYIVVLFISLAFTSIIFTPTIIMPVEAAASRDENSKNQTGESEKQKPEEIRKEIDEELYKYPTLYKFGYYDEIIARASNYLGDPYQTEADEDEDEEEKSKKDEKKIGDDGIKFDGRLYYWRGASAFAIGQLDLAESDLKEAKARLKKERPTTSASRNVTKDITEKGTVSSKHVYAYQGHVFYSKEERDKFIETLVFKPQNNPKDNLKSNQGSAKSTSGLITGSSSSFTATTDKLLNKIAQLKKLRPSKTYLIRNNDHIVFRVYYEQEDPVTKVILDTLFPAYTINDRFMQTYLPEIPIYIFNDRRTMLQFSGDQKISWGLAFGGRRGMAFCLKLPDGKPVSGSDEMYFRGAVAHELNHVIVQRAMGNVVLPTWFSEGLADVMADTMFPKNKTETELRSLTAFAAGKFIPPQMLENQEVFYKATGNAYAQQQKATAMGLRALTVDPYAQATQMVRYLLSNMGNGSLPEFLNTVREEHNFNRAFEDHFDATLPEFYKSWSELARQTYSSGNYIQ